VWGRALSAAALGLTCWGLYRLGERLEGRPAEGSGGRSGGILAVLLWLVLAPATPGIWIRPEMPALPLAAWSAYWAVRWAEADRRGRVRTRALGLSAVLAGLACYASPRAAFLVEMGLVQPDS